MVYDPAGGQAVAEKIDREYNDFGDIARKIGIGIYKK
jgi:hypothetical protein